VTVLATQAEAYARRHYVLLVLGLVCFFNYMDRYLIRVLLEPIKADLHITDTQAGLLMGFGFAIVYASFGVPLGRLADKKSRIRLLSAAIIVWSVMTAVSGLARNFFHLLLARAGVAFGEAGCVPAAHSLIADHFPPRGRAFAISLFQSGGIFGAMLGTMLGGVLAEAFGWRWTFVILGAPGVLIGLLALFTVREPERSGVATSRSATQSGNSMLSAVGGLLRQRAYRHVVLAIALENFVSIGVGAWTLAFFMRVHGMSLAEVGLWLGALSGVGGVVGTLVGGAASTRLVGRDRRWEVWLPAAAAAAALPLYLVSFLSPVATIAVGAAFATAFITQLGNGAGLASIQSVAPPESRALAVSLLLFANAVIGLGLGPLAVGVISDWFQPSAGDLSLRYALLAVLVVSVWSIAHFLLAARSFRQDAQT
jgi:predicted MFS family arabinose efflux permease